MNQEEQELMQLFKEEIDDNLFQNMNFEDHIKKEVKERIKINKKGFQFRDWFVREKKKWAAGMIGATVMASGFFIVGIQMSKEDLPLGKTEENLNQPFRETSDANPMMTTDDPLILPGENHQGELPVKTWNLTNIDDAKAWYGRELLVPSNVHDFTLKTIIAFSKTSGEANKIVMNYTKENKSFLIMQEKVEPLIEPFTYENIDINGVEGFIKSDETITELQWTINEIHFMVIGTLSKEEALKIAQSLK